MRLAWSWKEATIIVASWARETAAAAGVTSPHASTRREDEPQPSSSAVTSAGRTMQYGSPESRNTYTKRGGGLTHMGQMCVCVCAMRKKAGVCGDVGEFRSVAATCSPLSLSVAEAASVSSAAGAAAGYSCK